jgi:hypothetical protein
LAPPAYWHESVDISEWSALALNNVASVEADPDGGICVLCMFATPPGDGETGAMEFPGCPEFSGFPTNNNPESWLHQDSKMVPNVRIIS